MISRMANYPEIKEKADALFNKISFIAKFMAYKFKNNETEDPKTKSETESQIN